MVLNDYLDFEIEVQPRRGKRYPLRVRSPVGETQGYLVLPNRQADHDLLRRLSSFNTNEDSLRRIGRLLFDALFRGEVANAYTASRSKLGPRQGLRIRLRMEADNYDFIGLPWEFLTDRKDRRLVMDDAPVVRHLRLSCEEPPLKADLPLRVLLTAAQACAHADVARELDAIHEALQPLGAHVKVHCEPHLTTRRLRDHLENGYHIWHFVGHGGWNENKSAVQLQFEDLQGDPVWVSAQTLSERLSRSELRLVVLNACDSARLALEPFRAIAPALMSAGIPAVVAQQFSVEVPAARAFAADFYSELACGRPLEACVTKGRHAANDVAGDSRPDWGIPVVYMRAANGKLFDLPRAAYLATSQAHAAASTCSADGEEWQASRMSTPPKQNEQIKDEWKTSAHMVSQPTSQGMQAQHAMVATSEASTLPNYPILRLLGARLNTQRLSFREPADRKKETNWFQETLLSEKKGHRGAIISAGPGWGKSMLLTMFRDQGEAMFRNSGMSVLAVKPFLFNPKGSVSDWENIMDKVARELSCKKNDFRHYKRAKLTNYDYKNTRSTSGENSEIINDTGMSDISEYAIGSITKNNDNGFDNTKYYLKTHNRNVITPRCKRCTDNFVRDLESHSNTSQIVWLVDDFGKFDLETQSWLRYCFELINEEILTKIILIVACQDELEREPYLDRKIQKIERLEFAKIDDVRDYLRLIGFYPYDCNENTEERRQLDDEIANLINRSNHHPHTICSLIEENIRAGANDV